MSEVNAKFRVVFDPDRYSQRVLALILDKAEEWKCSPLEAEARLLDQLAEAQLKDKGEAA
jgi:hypothetical protein